MKKLSANQKGFSIVQILLVVVVLGLIGGVGYYVYQRQNQPKITNFEECKAAGNPIMESYPEQCAADGQTFTNEVKTDAQIDETDVPADETEAVAFDSLSSELQDSIIATYKKDVPDCQSVDSSQPYYYSKDGIVQAYVPLRAATVLVGCEGGAVNLFVYAAGSWKDVASTQMAFECALVDKYKVPATVVSSCLQADGSTKIVTQE